MPLVTRTTVAAFAVSLGLGLAACGDDDPGPESGEGDRTESTQPAEEPAVGSE